LNLVIDIGNSRTKMAIFNGREMVKSFHFDDLTIVGLKEILEEFQGTERAILSSVVSVDPSLYNFLKTAFSYFLELNTRMPMPVKNNYLTPETLGLDRIAAAIGAMEIFPDQDLLVIDAGTAITFDLIGREGTFLGGNISPGLKTRFRSLHEFTQKLPLVQETDQYIQIGQSTQEAIQAGVVNGMVFEIDGMIDELKKKYPEIRPVLSGGDARFFERRLKSHIFVKFEITLIGLNRILEYNVEKQ
jgi:type III pantothenate kinase